MVNTRSTVSLKSRCVAQSDDTARTLNTLRHSRLGLSSACQMSGMIIPYFSLRGQSKGRREDDDNARIKHNFEMGWRQLDGRVRRVGG